MTLILSFYLLTLMIYDLGMKCFVPLMVVYYSGILLIFFHVHMLMLKQLKRSRVFTLCDWHYNNYVLVNNHGQRV